jgi:hypothetical protein
MLSVSACFPCSRFVSMRAARDSSANVLAPLRAFSAAAAPLRLAAPVHPKMCKCRGVFFLDNCLQGGETIRSTETHRNRGGRWTQRPAWICATLFRAAVSSAVVSFAAVFSTTGMSATVMAPGRALARRFLRLHSVPSSRLFCFPTHSLETSQRSTQLTAGAAL